MAFMNLFFTVAIGFAVLYLLGPVFRSLKAVAVSMRDISAKSRKLAADVISDNGALATKDVIMTAGAGLVLTTLFVVFVAAAYVLLVPPLGPLMGFAVDDLDAVGAGPITYASIAAAVFVPVVGGLWLGDLSRWSAFTPVARVRHGRVAAFYFAAFSMVWAFAFALVAGVYKGTLGMADVIGAAEAEAAAAHWGSFLVASADCLALIGATLCAVGLEGFFKLVVAVVAAIAAGIMWLLAVLSDSLVILLTPVLEFIYRVLAAVRKLADRVGATVNTPAAGPTSADDAKSTGSVTRDDSGVLGRSVTIAPSLSRQ